MPPSMSLAPGVEVRGTESLPNPTAELTWALIHAITRRVENEDRAVRAGRWQTRVGDDLTGRTLGVVGLGRLGSRVARVAVAFEMSVLAWSPHLTLERAYPHQARYVPLAELLSVSDIVTIHLVLGEGTRGVIGAGELARMKPSAWLVNTRRGRAGRVLRTRGGRRGRWALSRRRCRTRAGHRRRCRRSRRSWRALPAAGSGCW